MGEDLKKANKEFEKVYKTIERLIGKDVKVVPYKHIKGICYLCYLKGFRDGSGEVLVME